jgi:hypothetical protein
MELQIQPILSIVQQLGGLGILALMVYLSPKILAGLSDLNQKMIGTVRETQTEALSVFKTEQSALIDMIDRRFQSTEGTLTKLVETLTTLVGEVKSLGFRVDTLERDKPK